MKIPQDLPQHLPSAFGLAVRAEAIAQLPGAVVKRRANPVKHLDSAIT
jgi:hypothetical protein